ncbi:hypothetical protein S245_070020, partial [Arachis hypogaea]
YFRLQIGVVLLPFMNRLLIDLELPRIMRDQKQHMRKLPRDKRCLLPLGMQLSTWNQLLIWQRNSETGEKLPQPASDALAKGARALEETMPEEAIQLYTDVITILEEDGGGQIAFDLYPKLSRVKFFSILDPTRPCNYVSEISDAGFLGPLFKVTMEEHPTEAFTNTSADKCWETILDRLNAEIERCKSLGEQELPPLEVLQSINGHKMFGFLKPSIIQVTQSQILKIFSATEEVMI